MFNDSTRSATQRGWVMQPLLLCQRLLGPHCTVFTIMLASFSRLFHFKNTYFNSDRYYFHFFAAYRFTERPRTGYHDEEVMLTHDAVASSSKSGSKLGSKSGTGTKYSEKKMLKSGIHGTEYPTKKPGRKPTAIPNTGAAPGSGPAPGYGKPKMCYIEKMLRQILALRKETARGKCDESMLCKKVTFIAEVCNESD